MSCKQTLFSVLTPFYYELLVSLFMLDLFGHNTTKACMETKVAIIDAFDYTIEK